MKNLKQALITTLILLLFVNVNVFSQGKHGGGHGNKKQDYGNKNNERYKNPRRNSINNGSNYRKQVNKNYHKKSVYRPRNFHNYRPIWAHHHNYNRRWVYFPQQNFYYDNWRQVYFYKASNIWRMNVSLPPSFIVINLEDERHFELSDDDDEMDRIYMNNNKHFTLFELNIITK